MAKKQFFCVLDSETTMESTVADFSMVICDKQGVIHNQMAVLVHGEYGTKSLFYDANASDEIWTINGLKRREANYIKMLENGQRMLASVSGINKWIMQAIAKYNPTLTAYNLAFDLDKCQNTGIDLTGFNERFCLWYSANAHFAESKEYRNFILQNHLFNTPTKLGNMTYQTNAEVMASFLNGEMLPPEPHTALEDIIFYELPILKKIVSKSKWKEKTKAYNWRERQVKDYFIAK